MLKSVIHDWDDERAATILRHVRAVIPDHGRLLIIERVLPDRVEGTSQSMMYLGDLNMLVNMGGRERTRVDFEQLCQRTGFQLDTVTPLAVPDAFSVLEAVPTARSPATSGDR